MAVLISLDLTSVNFLGDSISGYTLLLIGIAVCVAGMAFGLVIYRQLQALPVHRTMKDVSELIYETCKACLFTQGKFILVLWLFIAAIIVVYFGFLSSPEAHTDATLPVAEAAIIAEAPAPAAARPSASDWPTSLRVATILAFSLVGIAGSYAVAWFGIRINTFANSRTSHAALRGKPFPCYGIPLKAGMSIGMGLISVELVI
ncbi:MAG TPA: sodium/proton-translocating pyrophosphatase, partial [Tepidisphaeraceae bacterium]|nr:sodium/proton-translocating pyrophosphatase [Tepidisphaeraceae bacterium]